MNKLQNKLHQLLQQEDGLDLAIGVLVNTIKMNAAVYSDVISVNARLGTLKKDLRTDVINYDYYLENHSQLVSRTLELIGKVTHKTLHIPFDLDEESEIYYTFMDQIGNGYQYWGHLKNGKPHGNGLAKYSDKSQYEGHFARGVKHGKGVEMFPNGSRQEGEWKNGELVNTVSLDFERLKTALLSLDHASILPAYVTITNTLLEYKERPLVLELMTKELSFYISRTKTFPITQMYEKSTLVSQKEMQATIQHYMDFLNEGDEYNTVSILSFWSSKTLPHPMEFLDSNIAAAKRRVKIKRVIVINKRFEGLSEEEKSVLNLLARATLENPNIETRIYKLQELSNDESFENVNNVALFTDSKARELLIEMQYHPGVEPRKFRGMLINTIEKEILYKRRRFQARWERGIGINDYLKSFKHLIFGIRIGRNEKACIYSVDQELLQEDAWLILEGKIRDEPALINYSAEELKKRWVSGFAAIAIGDFGEIIGYVSLIPVFQNQRISTILSQVVGMPEYLPKRRMLEFVSGWTDKHARGKGISKKLRIELMKRFQNSDTSFISLTCGYSASPVSNSLGWCAVPWGKYPFVNSLIGIFNKEKNEFSKFGNQGLKAMPIGNRTPYCGPNITPSDFSAHEHWDNHFYLWVDNLRELIELEKKLERMFCNFPIENKINLWRNCLYGIV